MGIPFIIGASQQKRAIGDLGFETYCAPDNFDRTAQPVDIYDVFERYYRTNHAARYIYRVMDSFTANSKLSPNETPLFNGTSYHIGYEKEGIQYDFDFPSIQYPGPSNISFTTTSITVASTEGFPNSGKIICSDITNLGWNRSPYFTYTSKDATTFYGPSQTIQIANNYRIANIIDWTGTTKRWVIVNYTGISATACLCNYMNGPDWLYCGNLINEVKVSDGYTGVASTVKYIHVDKLTNIIYYTDGCGANSKLVGTLYISPSLYNGELGVYTIGFESRSIFSNSYSITRIVLPDTVKRISSNAFYNCRGLTSLILNDGLEYIRSRAFSGCSSITGTLTIPASVTHIDPDVFTETMFTDVVSYSAYFNCTDSVLYDVSIPNTVKANYSCRGKSGVLLFRNDTTEILSYCSYKNSLKTGSLNLPIVSCYKLGDFAFYECSELTGNLVIPDCVEIVGDYTFFGEYKMTGTLTIGSSVKTLGNMTFSQTKLTGDIIIPDSVISMGASFNNVYYGMAFNGNIVIGNGLVSIPNSAFQYLFSARGTVTIGSSVQTIGANAFLNCYNLTGGLNIPASVTTINNNSFSGASFDSVTSSSANYPAEDNVLYDVKTIGKIKAMYGALKYSGPLTLKINTTDILANCFYNNVSRTGNLSIPNTVTDIASGAFYGCSGLNGTLTVGSGLVTMVSENQFYNTNFSSITSSSTNYPAEDNVLYDVKTVGQVQAVIGAKGYVGTLTLKTGTTKILANCFYLHTNRSGTLTLLSTVTHINSQGFYGASSFNRCDSYPSTAPTVAASGLTFGGTARALHIPTGGGTGYGVAPWTTAAIFTQPPVADL